MTSDFGQSERIIQDQIDRNRGRVRVAADLSGEGLEDIHREMALEKTLGEDALREFEAERGLAAPGTSEATRQLGPPRRWSRSPKSDPPAHGCDGTPEKGATMADTNDARQTGHSRMSWLDESSSPQIDAYTERLGTFLEAMADGTVDETELKDQKERLVAMLRKVEPELGDALHGEVTKLLCELTAYNIMQTVHNLAEARPRTQFRG